MGSSFELEVVKKLGKFNDWFCFIFIFVKDLFILFERER